MVKKKEHCLCKLVSLQFILLFYFFFIAKEKTSVKIYNLKNSWSKTFFFLATFFWLVFLETVKNYWTEVFGEKIGEEEEEEKEGFGTNREKGKWNGMGKQQFFWLFFLGWLETNLCYQFIYLHMPFLFCTVFISMV